MDKEYEDASLRDLLKNSLWIVSLSLFGFLVISLIVTKIATAPVEKSWKQQKQLVADMSHELKTPLTVISANADIVLANRDSTVAEQEKWLVYIRQETERMTKLINEMLYLAKHDDGRAEEEMVPFDLSEVAESCTLPFESV
ncbi:MAG: histidine kinase dimerization/phospho-acceptor domain-containing protein [Acutalibacteraceae bacterium]